MLTQFTPKHCILDVSAPDDFSASVQTGDDRLDNLGAPMSTEMQGRQFCPPTLGSSVSGVALPGKPLTVIYSSLDIAAVAHNH
jgi:hypothetical protein